MEEKKGNKKQKGKFSFYLSHVMHHVSMHGGRGEILPHILEVHQGNSPQKIVPPRLGLVSQEPCPTEDSLITGTEVEEDATRVEFTAVTIIRVEASVIVVGASVAMARASAIAVGVAAWESAAWTLKGWVGEEPTTSSSKSTTWMIAARAGGGAGIASRT